MSESYQEHLTAPPRPMPPPLPADDRPCAPHRGPIILVLGILGIVMGGIGLILGPIAWIMGRNDLRAMDAGRMDSSGRGHTNAGRICGMVATLVQGVGVVSCLGYFLFMGAMFTSIVGAAAKSQAQVQKARADAVKAPPARPADQQAPGNAEHAAAWAAAVAAAAAPEVADPAGDPTAPPRPPKIAKPVPAAAAPPADPAPLPAAPKDEAAPANPPAAAAAPKAVRRTLDLIRMIDTSNDIVRGKWGVFDNVLRCNDQHFVPRVQIRYEPPLEYDFLIEFSQPKLRHPVTAVMPNRHGGAFLWKVGLHDGNDYQLASTSGQVGRARDLVRANTRHTTIVQVRSNSVRCFLDGSELLNQQTNFKDLTSDVWNKMPDPRCLGVACDDPTVFHRVWLVEISGPGKRR